MSSTHPPFTVMVGIKIAIKDSNTHLIWELVPSPMHCSTMPQILLGNGPCTHLVAEAVLCVYVQIQIWNFHCREISLGIPLMNFTRAYPQFFSRNASCISRGIFRIVPSIAPSKHSWLTMAIFPSVWRPKMSLRNDEARITSRPCPSPPGAPQMRQSEFQVTVYCSRTSDSSIPVQSP